MSRHFEDVIVYLTYDMATQLKPVGSHDFHFRILALTLEVCTVHMT